MEEDDVISDYQKLITRLEKLRDEWCILADGLEMLYDENLPAAKTIRNCIGDLYRAIHDKDF